ncbi:MAG: hypothetical protein AAGF93_05450 [Cyanobacteria bacterium P01_H01_bin.105]
MFPENLKTSSNQDTMINLLDQISIPEEVYTAIHTIEGKPDENLTVTALLREIPDLDRDSARLYLKKHEQNNKPVSGREHNHVLGQIQLARVELQFALENPQLENCEYQIQKALDHLSF